MYFAPSPNATVVGAAGGARDTHPDLSKVNTRRVVLDSAHFDMASRTDCHFDCEIDRCKNVCGIGVVQCVIPRYVGEMKHATLTATKEVSGVNKQYVLHAYAPASATLREVGEVFRGNLEEDSRQAATGSFESPWFQNLTIKLHATGFVVMEYYTTAGKDVSNVELDVGEFAILESNETHSYLGGVATSLTSLNGGVTSDGIASNSFWTFSQEVMTVHPTHGCPYLCLEGVEGLTTPIAGHASMLSVPTPHDILAVLPECNDGKPFHTTTHGVRWFPVPLPSLSRLRLSVRDTHGELYPALASGRSVIVLEIYSEDR